MRNKNHYNNNLDFDFEEENPSRIFSLLTATALIIAIIGFSGLVWYAYKSYNQSQGSNEIPIIMAEKEPFKTKPNEQGGMEFADTDKEFFTNLNEKSVVKSEKIIPSSEEPIDKATLNPPVPLPQETSTEKPVTTVVEQPITAPEKTTTVEVPASNAFAAIDEPKPMIVEPNTQPQTPANSPDEILPKQQIPEPIIETKIPKAKKFTLNYDELEEALEKDDDIAYRVQVAAFASRKEAIKFLKAAKTRNAQIFDNLESHIEAKNIPDKGLFFRLQVGAFADESGAKKLCKKLKENNYDCFIVKSPN